MNLRPQRKDPPDVNLTPLIDVVFLLLIFFMVSTTFEKEAQIKVILPQANTAAVVEELPQVLDIIIDADGRFYVNNQEVINSDVTTIKQAITKAAAGAKDIPVVITGDANASWQAIMKAMDAASQLGFSNMTFPATLPVDNN
ncbi:Biopolymer transport protein ExbD/TolR [hydrothermal vent metagenome]|uniref:Biopolymer transport protein ExbD/TolR n=1 Tax=hydrothermal vent metagenome TaxID=652676 RepID=A0A3B1BAA0_9ZZZZ